MAYTIPVNTKFATIHFHQCATADDLPDDVDLGGDWSAHRAQVIELSAFDASRIGADRAEDFRESNFVLVAARPSALPTVRDEEWKELEQQVFRLFYAMLMFGVPSWTSATLIVGGRGDEGDVFAGHIRFLWYFRHPHALKHRVAERDLRAAATVANRYRQTLASKEEFLRLKRGVYRLSRGWREEGFLADRLHEFVRALDGLMQLSKGSGEKEFVERVATFAESARIADIGREIYRLRSFNEHLSDWPSELGYVKKPDRDRMVSERAFQAELIAGAAYRIVLADPGLTDLFRNDATIRSFWASTLGKRLVGSVDLDARARDYEFGLDW